MATSGNKVGTVYIEAEARLEKAERDLANFRAEAEHTSSAADKSANEIGESFDSAGNRVKTGMGKGERGAEEFRKELERLEREAAEARRELERLGQEAQETGSKAGGASGGLAGGFNRASESASKFQGLLGKILIPVAVFASVKGLIDGLTQASREAEVLQRNLNNVADAANLTAERARTNDGISELRKSQQAFLDASQERADALIDQYQEFLADTSSLWSRAKIGIADLIAEGDQSRATTARKFQEAVVAEQRAALEQSRALQRAADREAKQRAEEYVASLEESRLSAIERERLAERRTIGELLSLREDAESESLRKRIDDQIHATQLYHAANIKAIHDEEALRLRLIEDRKAAELEAIESRADALEKSLMTASERERARRREELDEVEKKIIDITSDGVQDNEREMLSALDRIHAALVEQGRRSSEAVKRVEKLDELPAIIERSVDSGVNSAMSRLGLLNVQQTLYAIQQNADLIAGEVTR